MKWRIEARLAGNATLQILARPNDGAPVTLYQLHDTGNTSHALATRLHAAFHHARDRFEEMTEDELENYMRAAQL